MVSSRDLNDLVTCTCSWLLAQDPAGEALVPSAPSVRRVLGEGCAVALRAPSGAHAWAVLPRAGFRGGFVITEQERQVGTAVSSAISGMSGSKYNQIRLCHYSS